MHSKIPRIAFLMMACLLVCGLLTGCKPSKKKVESSSYYKELNKKYKKLKKENEKLKKEIESKDAPSEDEQRAIEYLEKISRDRLISLEVGFADNIEGGELITDKTVFPAATMIVKRADLTSKYTPDEVAKKYGPGYEYILYDEDNAVYEIMVYGGNYVVFTDLPNNVYYSYNASALGDAFLHYRDGYPNSKLLHRLAESPLVTDGKYCYENDTAFKVANYIRTMDRKNSSRKKADKAWLKDYRKKHKKKDSQEESDEEETQPDPSEYEPEGAVYTFYHHGNIMTMTLYDEYICIRNMDEKETWYLVSKNDIKELKKLFQVPEDQKGAEKKDSKDKDSEKKQSHEKEIEEESAQ